MAIIDRLTYTLIGSLFGALIGLACWWLYGLGHSLHFNGEGFDPVLLHWVIYVSATFAIIGFLFREFVAEVIGDVINAIFQTEVSQAPDSRSVPVIAIVFLICAFAVILFTVPS